MHAREACVFFYGLSAPLGYLRERSFLFVTSFTVFPSCGLQTFAFPRWCVHEFYCSALVVVLYLEELTRWHEGPPLRGSITANGRAFFRKWQITRLYVCKWTTRNYVKSSHLTKVKETSQDIFFILRNLFFVCRKKQWRKVLSRYLVMESTASVAEGQHEHVIPSAPWMRLCHSCTEMTENMEKSTLQVQDKEGY